MGTLIDDEPTKIIDEIINNFSIQSKIEKNDLIDLLLNKAKRNYETHGVIDDFIDGIINAQVEGYGHWIPQDPAGKKRESHRILQESTGNSLKWKQYSDRKFLGFFLVDSS